MFVSKVRHQRKVCCTPSLRLFHGFFSDWLYRSHESTREYPPSGHLIIEERFQWWRSSYFSNHGSYNLTKKNKHHLFDVMVGPRVKNHWRQQLIWPSKSLLKKGFCIHPRITMHKSNQSCFEIQQNKQVHPFCGVFPLPQITRKASKG